MPLPVIAGAAISAGLGMMQQGMNDSRQIRQQGELTEQQMRAQKEMGIFNRQQSMKMWEDTNYKAQVEQMKKAGINPGLLYSNGGGGGTTAGTNPGNVTGAQAPQGGGEINAALAQGMQLQLLKAQKENIEADTENKKAGAGEHTANADYKNGVGTQVGLQQASNIAQDTLNKKAQEELTKVQTEIANIEKYVEGAAKEDRIKQVKYDAIEAVLQNANTRADTALKGEQKWKTIADKMVANEQVKKIANEVMQDWDKLEIDRIKARLEGLKIGDGSKETMDALQNAVMGILMLKKGGK